MTKVILVYYGTVADGAGQRLQRVIEGLVPKEKLEVYGTSGGLARRLRQPLSDVTMAVVLAATREDFSRILSICDLLYYVRIILILPDREEDTIAKGHSLRPRFVTYADSDFLDVAAVLGKVLRHVITSKP
ncbi:MAG: hypothetical protein D4R73_10185 [Deltaproteobacteria bacterium]|nr:MAG: hypothetical protein D4R73_10185 [Deltaproteobacteria bacterium]